MPTGKEQLEEQRKKGIHILNMKVVHVRHHNQKMQEM